MDVLITGADSEPGRVIVEKFCDAGHNVVISGTHRNDLAVVAKQHDIPEEHVIVCDASDPASLTQVRSRIPAHLDSIITVPKPIAATSDPRAFTVHDVAVAWRTALDATVVAAALTLHSIGDHLRSGGSIICVVADHGNSNGSNSIDDAIKAALSHWVAGQADHYGARGVTINTVACSHDAGPLYAATYDGLSSAPTAPAADIARLALFLATPAARHITGQTLHVGHGAIAHCDVAV